MKLSAIIKFIILIGIASIVFSCTDDLDINNNYQFSICATLPELQEGTKATATDVIRMSWSENDAISVINVTTGKVLGGSLVVNAAGTSSVFSGTITGSINKDDKLAFIYPSQNYSKEGDFEPFIIDYSMQTTTQPKLTVLAHYTVEGKANEFQNLSLGFAYKLAFMKLNLAECPVSTKITRISLNGMNDRLRFSISNGELVAQAEKSEDGCCVYYSVPASTVTNDKGNKSVFWGILPASAQSRIMTVESLTAAYSAPFANVAFEERAFYNANASNFVSAFIEFQDKTVKETCVNRYDKNGDGEISFLEAAAVTDLGLSTKSSGTNPFPYTISSFKELKYFSGITTMPSFEGYDALKEISIPVGVTALPDYCFKDCYTITNIVFYPETPPIAGIGAFDGLGQNILITVPDGALEIYKSTYRTMAEKIEEYSQTQESVPDGGLEETREEPIQ